MSSKMGDMDLVGISALTWNWAGSDTTLSRVGKDALYHADEVIEAEMYIRNMDRSTRALALAACAYDLLAEAEKAWKGIDPASPLHGAVEAELLQAMDRVSTLWDRIEDALGARLGGGA